MARHVLLLLLASSLLINATAVGAFVYKRYYLAPRANLETVASQLELDDAGRERLVQLRRDSLAAIIDGARAVAPAAIELNNALAERPIGDPAFGAALDHLASARRGGQERLIARVVRFRDSLPPKSRERFAVMAQDPAFVLVLLGLRPDADEN